MDWSPNSIVSKKRLLEYDSFSDLIIDKIAALKVRSAERKKGNPPKRKSAKHKCDT